MNYKIMPTWGLYKIMIILILTSSMGHATNISGNVSGTGVMATLVFQANGISETEILFNAEVTTLRKANNHVIEIEELAGGVVAIE